MFVLALTCAVPLAGVAEAATKPAARPVMPTKLWSEYPLDPARAKSGPAKVNGTRNLAAKASTAQPSPEPAARPATDDRRWFRLDSPAFQLSLMSALGLIVVLAALSSLSSLVPARVTARRDEREGDELDRAQPLAVTNRIRRKVGPEPAALRPAAVPSEHAAPRAEPVARPVSRPATWLAEPYESCEIAIWRGYLKSQFYARPTFPEPGDYAIALSPLFRSRVEVPKQCGRTLAAYEALVARLLRQGWEPSGLGGEWYEQWFRRPLLLMPVPRSRETNGIKTPV